MNPQKKKSASNSSNHNSNTFARKPRQSIKVEGNCLTGMLKDGCAKVIDASKLGKRLSSEIWNSFGAIQVQDNFTYPSIHTKLVPEGSSTLRVCQFFVACSKCFSVFKYDGHAYGTTGLVKHVKICSGRIRNSTTATNNSSNINTNNNSSSSSNNLSNNASNDQIATNNLPADNTTPAVLGVTPISTTPTTNSMSNALNGPTPVKRTTNRNRSTNNNNQPSVKYLAKVIEELRREQMELKHKIQDMINIVNSGYVGQIQIISNEGEKVDDEMQKSD